MRRVAEALEKARQTRSRIGKEEALAEMLRSIPDDEGLALAARMATGIAMAPSDPRPLGVGWALLSEVAEEVTGVEGWMLRECARRVGELGEAFGLLVARLPPRPGLALHEVAELYESLARAGRRDDKKRLLLEAFGRAGPLETKYLAKIFHASLRVGAQGGVLEGAIARAFGRELDVVRAAAAIVTDPGATAVLARHDQLADARVEIGRPVAYMLATPLESIAAELDPALHVMEDKIDGVRAQLHVRGGEVAIFARGLERVTAAYPELVEAFADVGAEAPLLRNVDVALDGEIVAVGEGNRPRPFLALQSRLRRNEPTAALLREVPVAYFAYDLLADADGDHLALPFAERRARLERWAEEHGPTNGFVLNAVSPMGELDPAFEAARARGNEGLVLKRVDAPYEAGRRGQAWIKVKKAFATLDVVITAAQEGSGKRAGVLSDYTFAVWSGDELQNVGKAYSGLTDAEIDVMTTRLTKLTLERYGGVRLVAPEIVLEVGFDGIQRSTRHKSGYALRFPRIVRIRDDKRAAEADTLDTVKRLFESQLETGHRENEVSGASAVGKTAKERAARAEAPKKPRKQLSLFDDE